VTDRSGPDEPDRVVIHDRRRIDPITGEVRHPDPDPAADRATSVAPPLPGVGRSSEAELAERTADLQRLQAEFANYRKRVDRDRVVVGELAAGRVIADLLPVLDDIDRARAHGDLTGAFKAVADQLDTVLAKHGLVAFGEVGDRFDPARHEAVMHGESTAVQVPTTTTVMRRGYEHHDRLLRPAMVGVTDPVAPGAAPDQRAEPNAAPTDPAPDSASDG
jgi:molecular chaperone GrpE